MESLRPCATCGCTNFEQKSGFYVCTNCDVQSQQYQEQSFDFGVNFTKEANIETEVVMSESVCQSTNYDAVSERDQTSWERYNVILNGILKELIEMGASYNIRIVAFQLWVRYLQKTEVAFISKKSTKFPKLPLAFQNSDAKILYGIDNLREKLFEDVCDLRKKDKKKREENDEESMESGTSIRRLRKKKKRKLEALELRSSAQESENESFDLNSLRSSQSKRVKVKFVRNAGKRINSIKEKISDFVKSSRNEESEIESEAHSDHRSKISALIYRLRRLKHNNKLTMTTLLAICQLALYIIMDDIQLGDILRWSLEGRISINRPERFSCGFKMYRALPFLKSTHNGLKTECCMLAQLLEVNNIPGPNLYTLTERYSSELQLPGDFVKCVHSIISLHPPKMNYVCNKKYFPPYECRSMAYILFVAKLLFSLNDVVEISQSKFAELRNCSDDYDGEVLFSWNNWMKYIECRKITLARFGCLFDQTYYNGRLSGPHNFPDYWSLTQPLYKLKRKGLNAACSSAVENMLTDLKSEEEFESINLPSSLTPQATGLEYLLQNHTDLIPSKACNILSQDFTCTTISFILNSEYECNSSNGDVSKLIVVNENLPKSMILKKENPPVTDHFSLRNSTTARLPYGSPMEIKIIDDNVIEEKIGNKLRKKVQPPIVVPYNDNSDEESEDQLNIYKHLKNYVFYHNCRKIETYTNFNELMETKFPFSFCWLLRECAATILAEPKDVYMELIRIECTLYKKFVDSKYKFTLPFPMNEW